MLGIGLKGNINSSNSAWSLCRNTDNVFPRLALDFLLKGQNPPIKESFIFYYFFKRVIFSGGYLPDPVGPSSKILLFSSFMSSWEESNTSPPRFSWGICWFTCCCTDAPKALPCGLIPAIWSNSKECPRHHQSFVWLYLKKCPTEP